MDSENDILDLKGVSCVHSRDFLSQPLTSSPVICLSGRHLYSSVRLMNAYKVMASTEMRCPSEQSQDTLTLTCVIINSTTHTSRLPSVWPLRKSLSVQHMHKVSYTMTCLQNTMRPASSAKTISPRHQNSHPNLKMKILTRVVSASLEPVLLAYILQ